MFYELPGVPWLSFIQECSQSRAVTVGISHKRSKSLRDRLGYDFGAIKNVEVAPPPAVTLANDEVESRVEMPPTTGPKT